jgi:thioredoxin-related protein
VIGMVRRILSSCRTYLSICLLLGFAAPGLRAAGDVDWRSNYAQAMKEAGEKGRPLLVDVGTENCYWCKQLDVRTFNVPGVVKLLNERFVPLKVDAGQNSYLIKALRIQSYPTLVFAAPDGTIVGYKEGFVEADALQEQLLKVLASVGTPDWMKRDYEAALKAVAAGDPARAVSLLRNVIEDGKVRPVQVKARQLVETLEKTAAEQARKAGELADKGKTDEAIAAYDRVGRDFPGTLAAQQGRQQVMRLATRSAGSMEGRKRQAGELLELARQDYKGQRFLICLDRCELIAGEYADQPEAKEASRLAEQIKDNPEWARKACDQLGERLAVLYLSLADTWLRKGQPQQAIFYLQRVVRMFPGTRHAEMAHARLARLSSPPEPASDARK